MIAGDPAVYLHLLSDVHAMIDFEPRQSLAWAKSLQDLGQSRVEALHLPRNTGTEDKRKSSEDQGPEQVHLGNRRVAIAAPERRVQFYCRHRGLQQVSEKNCAQYDQQ